MALSADRKTESTEGVEMVHPVAATTQVHSGGLTCANAAGYAVPGADTLGYRFLGVSLGGQDNSSGSNGDLGVLTRRKGIFRFKASGLTQAMVGDDMYIVDDETFAPASVTTNDIKCGKLVKYESATDGWLDIERS